MSMPAPFFTIITATRNAAATLPRLLESLACQTCREFELIIQDGASQDGAVAVAEAWRARLPALHMASEPDAGIYDAWNKALARVRGQWVLFLGADDRLADAHTLELCKDILHQALPATSYAVGGANLCNSQDCVVMTMHGQADNVSSHLPKGYAPFWQNALFHHRSLFEKNRFDISLTIFGDYDFICRTWSDEHAIHIPFVVVSITLGGMSNNPAKLIMGRMETLRISQRYFSMRYVPWLAWAVAKASVAWGIYHVFGPAGGIKILNMLRKARGLAPTWNNNPRTTTDGSRHGKTPDSVL